MTGDQSKSGQLGKYNGNRAVLIADSFIRTVKDFGNVKVTPWYGNGDSILENMYHVHGMTNNLVLMWNQIRM